MLEEASPLEAQLDDNDDVSPTPEAVATERRSEMFTLLVLHAHQLVVCLVRFHHYQQPNVCNCNLENMVYFLAKLALLNYTALVYCPSMVAATAVYVARRILHKSPAWTETLKLHTQFTEAQLIDYANLLMTLHSTSSESKLQEVFRKYSRLERCAVALIWGVEILPYVDTDLRKIAERVTEKAKEFCISKSITDASVEVWEGDARNVMCEAVEKHHATLLVLGNHGYGAIKRAVLGSVSDYCAHHAHCSVMIVKRPKIKH